MALTSPTDALQRCVDIARDVVLDKIDRGQDFAFLSRAGERLYAQGKGPGSFVLHQLSMPTGKQPLRAIDADLLRAQVLQALAFFPVPEGPLNERLRPVDVDWCHDLFVHVSQPSSGYTVDTLTFGYVYCGAREHVVTDVQNRGGFFLARRLILPESVPDDARVSLRLGVHMVELNVPAYHFRASTLGAGRRYTHRLVTSQAARIEITHRTDHAFSFSAILVGLRPEERP